MEKLIGHPASFPMTTTALFVCALFLGVIAVPEADKAVPQWLPYLAKAVLACAFLVLAAWFHRDDSASREPARHGADPIASRTFPSPPASHP